MKNILRNLFGFLFITFLMVGTFSVPTKSAVAQSVINTSYDYSYNYDPRPPAYDYGTHTFNDSHTTATNLHTGTITYTAEWSTQPEFGGGPMGQTCDYEIGTDYLTEVTLRDINNAVIFTGTGWGQINWTNQSGATVKSVTLTSLRSATYYINDGVGGCYTSGWGNYNTWTIDIDLPAPTPDFSVSCTPPSASIVVGSTTAFNLSTTPENGFSSPVTWTHSISPSTGTIPTISYTNNNQPPAATTTALVTTTASTTPASYAIVFTASGGGQTHTCNVSLTVTAVPPSPSYSFVISPVSTDTMMGSSVLYDLTLNCNNGATGPVYGLTASSPFTGLTYEFRTLGKSGTVTTTINCAETLRLTVGNTGGIDLGQSSTPQARLGQSITVTGSGN